MYCPDYFGAECIECEENESKCEECKENKRCIDCMLYEKCRLPE